MNRFSNNDKIMLGWTIVKYEKIFRFEFGDKTFYTRYAFDKFGGFKFWWIDNGFWYWGFEIVHEFWWGLNRTKKLSSL